MASNRRYFRQQGAALVEFTLTFMVFLILVLGIIEFSLVVFDASRLTDATRAGARYAIVNSPACNIFGKSGGTFDTGCTSSIGNITLACDINPPADTATVDIDSCSAPAATPGCKIVELMDSIMLRGPDNSMLAGSGKLRLTYACSHTGDPRIPITVPEVTVEAIDVQHRMLFSSIFGFYSEDGSGFGPSVTLPSFKTTRTGEDMYNRP